MAASYKMEDIPFRSSENKEHPIETSSVIKQVERRNASLITLCRAFQKHSFCSVMDTIFYRKKMTILIVLILESLQYSFYQNPRSSSLKGESNKIKVTRESNDESMFRALHVSFIKECFLIVKFGQRIRK